MQQRSRRGRVDGVLLLDKPAGITSNAALQKARWLLNAAKAGHTGTLDPLASGLLPLTFGEATKFAADLLDADKQYEAVLALGVRTDTGDAEGTVLETRPVTVDRAEVDAALSRFTGSIAQVPPMHSALKRDGRALYEYARAGLTVERAPRPVTIHALQVVHFAGDRLALRVDCSKGTYVRVLAEDIGAALGCGAHLAALRRTRVGALTLDGAVTLEALAAASPAARLALLAAPGALVARLPAIVLDATLAARFRQGQRLAVDAQPRNTRVRVSGPNDELLGVAQVNDHGVLAPERLISNPVN